MKRGDNKNLVIDGLSIDCQYIGQGLFCKAYRNEERVFLLCEGDYSKECIALFCDQKLKHIPKIFRHENLREFQVFSMPFYHKLTKRDYPKAYALWKTLPSTVPSYQKALELVESGKLAKSVSSAILDLIEAFSNYDVDTMMLEFNRANVGVNERGELILRDCLASIKSIDAKRKPKKERGGGY